MTCRKSTTTSPSRKRSAGSTGVGSRNGPIAIDVAALRKRGAPESPIGAVEPQAWVPPAPCLVVDVDLAAVDGVEVQVFADDGEPRLAAGVAEQGPPGGPAGLRGQMRRLPAAG